MEDNYGKIHIYTGNGKGKTTAALGLALRAAGAGKNIFIAQFVKGMHYSELVSLEKHENITVKQYGRSCFIEQEPVIEDILAAQAGFTEVKEIIIQANYNVVILDEIFIALYYKLIKSEDLITFVKSKPENIELIMTGRYATDQFIEIADLVTEMKEIKHYYNNKIPARLGIEF
ncbi:MAG TPA: cob(I)yrinic acid a,c-diamide adenosyltransferase [Bacteroidales bacterium]|nr:cob(I)yrinic acid a,c-diamide adenosyltransferase [Bacteroidales bacterium]